MALRRDDLTDEFVDRVRERIPEGTLTFLSDEEREASLQSALADAPPGDVWLFGYGSLMWSPAFLHEESSAALVRGWHRRFCLWTPLGRGTPECPGLVLGLERGGACRGVAFRVARDQAEAELRLVWRREMLSGAYVPRWVPLDSPQGRLRALTFTINREHARYAGRLADSEAARHIAVAEGYLGTCREYLEESVAALEALGIRDRSMARLAALVAGLNCP